MIRGSSLKITLRVQGGDCETQLSSGNGRVSFQSKNARVLLEGSRARIAGDLTAARDDLGDAGGRCTVAAALSFLEALYGAGQHLRFYLFGARVREAEDFFRAALPASTTPENLPPPLIEIEAPDEFLLLAELIPVRTAGRDGPRTRDAVMDFARCFLGARGVINRTHLQPARHMDAVLRRVDRVPAKMFYDESFAGARAEARRLAKLARLSGPWPDRTARGRKAPSVMAHLVNIARDLKQRLRAPPDQIHHFSAHCDSSSTIATDHELIFRGRDEVERPLKLADVLDGWVDHWARNGDDSHVAKPLAFLNACNTAAQSPLQVASWADTFLRAGYRGFIGTEVNMPDGFASAFALRFYEHLLVQGRPAGEALWAAKWDLLRARNNPLGLLYTFYGNPDLQIETLKDAA